MPEVLAEIPVQCAGVDDREDDFRDFDGRVALHAEWRAAAAEEKRLGDGGDRWRIAWRWWSMRVDLAGRHRHVSRAAAAQSDGRDAEAGAGRERRCDCCDFSGDENHLFFQLGERLLLSRKLTGNFPGFRAGAAEGSSALGGAGSRGTAQVDRARRAVFRRAVAGHPVASSGRRSADSFVAFGNRRERREPAGGVRRHVRSRSGSTRSTCWISCARSNEDKVSVPVQGSATARASCGRQRRTARQVPLRGHADAHLSRRAGRSS